MLLNKFIKAKKIHPPEWLASNCHYLVYGGSRAYGTETESSDIDICGFCTPKKEMVFPQLAGIIKGFGFQGENFDRWSEQHVMFDDKEYDFSILGITHYFNLCFLNNPDQLDTLFVSRENIHHITSTGELVRNARHKFLSKRVHYRYKNYAYSQICKSEKEAPIGNRKVLRDKWGFDIKFAAHAVRLIYEAEMILMERDLDLQRYKDHVMAVKTGSLSLQDIKKWFGEKEKNLDKLYVDSKIPENPDENEIKTLLINCLENHYGDLSKVVHKPNLAEMKLLQIKKIIDEV